MVDSLNPGSDLCAPFLSVLPVSGVAISLLGGVRGPSTLSASNRQASRIDELQFDLGEGPCWQAFSSRRPVLSEDIRAEVPAAAWPSLVKALDGQEVGGLFAFPLAIGDLGIGAVDLYTDKPTRLDQGTIKEASALAGELAWEVLRRVLHGYESQGDGGVDDSGSSRREFHQATGMVLAQMAIPASDAALLIRAHAFSNGRTVLEVSREIVERSLIFSPGMT